MCSTSSSVGRLAEGIAACAAVDPAGLPSSRQVTELEELIVHERQVQAEIARRLRAAESTDALVAETGYGARSWLIAETHSSAGAASARVASARALTSLPAVAAHFAAGDLSAEHVRLLTKTLGAIPPGDGREQAETSWSRSPNRPRPSSCAAHSSGCWARLGLDDDAEAARQRRYGQRHCLADRSFDGYLAGSFLLDPTAGSALLTALDGYRAPTGPADERSVAHRRADALAAIAEYALSDPQLSDDQGDRPRVVITLARTDLPAQTDTHRGALDRRWEITPAQVRRALCDAELLPAVLGGDGAVLDLGRASPTWSTAQRRAVRLRDGAGCVFRACPHRWTRLHHATWWSKGGRTDLTNAVPLCGFHHWLMHDGGWHARRDTDGGYTFTSPHGTPRHQEHQHPHRQPQPA